MALNKVGFWDAEERVVVLNAEEIKARRAAGEEFPAVGLVGSGILETDVQRNFVEGKGIGTLNSFIKWQCHRRRNFLARIKVNGVTQCFCSLLSDPGDWRPNISGILLGLRYNLLTGLWQSNVLSTT